MSCVSSLRAKNGVQFLIDGKVLSVGCVPALRTELSALGLASFTPSAVQVVGRGLIALGCLRSCVIVLT